MKKQPIYLIMKMKDFKERHVEEVEGYVYDLLTDSGSIVKIGLHYIRPYWYATHYETGLACTPYTNPEEYCPALKWKSKEALIERLKQIDFKHLESVQKDFHNQCKQIIKEYKEGKHHEKL